MVKTTQNVHFFVTNVESKLINFHARFSSGESRGGSNPKRDRNS